MRRDSDRGMMPLAGWGNYPIEPCFVSAAGTHAELRRIVTEGIQPHYIARGLGRAYGDAALNRQQGVILQTAFNRLLAFDDQTGVLHCEAGVSLQEIIDVFLPRGWFLPTTPGTKFVTVGGAIAADVHGKNQHVDGTFGAHVLEIELLTAAGEVMSCAPDRHADVFSATLGGMGLTGCILTAKFRLVRTESAFVDVVYRRTAHVEETLELLRTTSADYRYSVAWIDCLSQGASLGRSVLMLANDAPRNALPAKHRDRPLQLPRKRPRSVPLDCPAQLLNTWSMQLFNALFYRRHSDSRQIVDYNTFFYPLDNLLHWNRIYGRRGFVQYQVLFPPEAALQGLTRVLQDLRSAGLSPFLAVLKATGPAGVGLLSFPRKGFTLAVDIPYTGATLNHALQRLDAYVAEQGGRLYLAKDATTSPAAFAAMYPSLPQFQAIKARIDPNQRFQSSQARRLGIVEAS